MWTNKKRECRYEYRKEVRILSTESPRVPEQRSSTQGKSGPAEARSVGDGQQVEIPVPDQVDRAKERRRRAHDRAAGRARPSAYVAAEENPCS